MQPLFLTHALIVETLILISLILCPDVFYYISVWTLCYLRKNQQEFLKQIQGRSTTVDKPETFSIRTVGVPEQVLYEEIKGFE